ncbi:hypothetical protein QCA50_005117 [Cerrena zonata]|uniref:N-acetyl-D-glucosamine kinase n=1 Tax=Cerrena zonata TaxID=2478898 RepID=A0AAW0GGG4_9APHY
MSLYLCVDCGGSKTSAVICNAQGEILGRALGGPSNYAYLGLESFIDVVKLTASDALRTCLTPPSIDLVPLPPSSPLFAAAWLGISGVDSQSAIDTLTPAVSEALGIPVGPRLIVCNDTHLLAAPLRMHDDVHYAVTCIAGTGSKMVSFSEGEAGGLKELGTVGGWGWILGDEGGGFHVGREAIRQMLTEVDVASIEGAPPPLNNGRPTLRDRVLEFFGVTHVYDLLTVIHFPDPTPSHPIADKETPAYLLLAREKRLSQLAPLVFSSAFEDGDPLALNVLRTTAGTVVDQLSILLRPNTPRGVSADDSVICFGGSLVGIEKYRQLVLDQLKEKGHVFKHVEFVADAAAVGAKGLVLALGNKDVTS